MCSKVSIHNVLPDILSDRSAMFDVDAPGCVQDGVKSPSLSARIEPHVGFPIFGATPTSSNVERNARVLQVSTKYAMELAMYRWIHPAQHLP